MWARLRSHSSANLRFLFGLVKDEGQTAFSAVLTIKVGGHEYTSTAVLVRTFTTQTSYLAILIHFVVLEDGELDLLLLVLVLLRCRVVLLLSLLGTSRQRWHEVQSSLAGDTA